MSDHPPTLGHADRCNHARALELPLERGIVASVELGAARQPGDGADCAGGTGYMRVVRGNCPGCCREVYRALVVRYATAAEAARVIRTPWTIARAA